jgi:hypothetical protein
MTNTIFVTVVVLRFLVPLLIPRFPLPAILACLVLDAADQSIFQMFTDDPLPGYQAYDKALDVYYLAIAYCSSMRNWRDPVAFQASRFLYLYRLVGVTLFELLHWRWLLLVFPNTFEYVFIAYEAVRTRWNPLRLTATAILAICAFIWIFIKLPQEWWIHIAQLDFTELMADNPYLWGVLAALVVIAGVSAWLLRRRIPVPDWPFTVDVDRHLPVLENVERPAHVLTSVLAEKVLFLALVSVIFAQVLPDVESSNVAIAIGVAGLVVVNALISEWLYRRGHSWASTLTTFLATLGVNIGIAFVDSLLGGADRATPRPNTLFFVLLLSLLIAMFDHMRATRGASDLRRSIISAVRAERAERADRRSSGLATDAVV